MVAQDDDFDQSLGPIANMNITGLARHKREKKGLRAPFHQLQRNMIFKSWKDDALPLYSWCAVAIGIMPRENYLKVFREIAHRVKYRHDTFNDEIFVNHASLRDLSNHQFDFIFEPLLSENNVRPHFASLSILRCLPDRDHWSRYGQIREGEATDLSDLASGYAQCFDHQSQQATDVRWLIVISFLANDKLTLDPSMSERFHEIVEYPNRGDMRSVRPSIRAMELTLRGDPRDMNANRKENKHETIAEEIWTELYDLTDCMPLPFLSPVEFDTRECHREVFDIYNELIAHYQDTTVTTNIDPRHDGAFGLVFYAMALLMEGLSLRPLQRISSRLILRTITEAHINLRFLKMKDDEAIWFQFRNYGSSQTKLAFLKYLDAKKKPDYVNMEELFRYANEDMWLEYQDINLGSWSTKSLRDIAIESGLKEVYDQHYQLLSTSVHAQWTGIRENNFIQCANPLHRFHRIPDFPKFSRDTLVPEMSRLVNIMLDDLSHLYPSFKSRLRKFKSIKGREYPLNGEAPKT
jgi:hypothetical protein